MMKSIACRNIKDRISRDSALNKEIMRPSFLDSVVEIMRAFTQKLKSSPTARFKIESDVGFVIFCI